MAKRIRQCLNGFVLFVVFSSTYAVAPGYYLGLQIGQANNDGRQIEARTLCPPDDIGCDPLTIARPTRKQAGLRLYTGYKYNPFISVEAGGTIFSFINYSTERPAADNTQLAVGAVDIVIKPSVTFGPIDIYAKGGISFNYTKSSAALNLDLNSNKSTQKWTYGPTYGIGASYDMTQSFVLNGGWNRVQVNRLIKYFDFFYIGVSYHLVDVYCGQFLCD